MPVNINNLSREIVRPNFPNGAENLVMHSILNLKTGKAIDNKDGSVSTLRSGSVNDPRLNNGNPTLIPFVYDGKEVDLSEAIERAVASNKQFPAFSTHEQATIFSKSISSQLPNTIEKLRNFKGIKP